MALSPDSLALQFSGGVDTKTDGKQVATTKLLALENATFTKNGTLSKRNGYQSLGTSVDGEGGDYVNVRGLGARDDDLVLMTDGGSYSYRPSSDTWSNIGDVSSVTATCLPVARTGTAQHTPDSATMNGVTLLAWVDSRGGVWCSTIEATTQRILAAPKQLDASGLAPRVIATEASLVAIWPSTAVKTTLYSCAVNPALPGLLSARTILVEDLDATSQLFDAISAPAVTTTGTLGVLGWVTSSSTYRMGYVATDGTIGTPAAGYASVVTWTTTTPIKNAFSFATNASGSPQYAVIYSSTSAAVDFLSGIASRSRQVNNIGALTTSTCVHATVAWGPSMDPAGGTSRQSLWWAVELNDGTDTSRATVVIGALLRTTTDLDASIAQVLQGHCLASKGFTDGPPVVQDLNYHTHAYVAVVRATQFFPYIAVIRMSNGNGNGPSTVTGVPMVVPGVGGTLTCCVARLLEIETTGALFQYGTSFGGGPGGTGGGSSGGGGTAALISHILPSVDTTTRQTTRYGRQHVMTLGYRIQLNATGGTTWSEAGIKLCTLDFNAPHAFQTAQYGRNLYLAGASLSSYDGSSWAEATINTAPDLGYDIRSAPLDFAGILMADGATGVLGGTYLYKFWYEHIDGQGELHRGPVQSVLYEAGVNHKVVINVPSYTLTRRANVRVGVARSAQGATGTDASIPCYRITSTDPQSTGDNGFLANDPNDVTVAFVDNLSDAQLLTCEPLYTDGGILSNDMAHVRGDVIAGGKGRLFWTDPTDPNLVRYSQPRSDETAIEAPAQLSVQVDPLGGPIVGLGILDDAVVVFKSTAVHFFGGPGPDADGGQSTPDAFSPAQLVTSDVGCSSSASIAQTPAGIVFQSSKGIYLVGRDRNVTFIGQDVYGYKDQVITRATLLPDRHQVVFLTSAGATLLWDYERQQWSTYTNHAGLSAVVTGGVYHYLRADGRVFAETVGAYSDDGDPITLAIETAWIKMSGTLQGWQKVLRAMFIGSYESSHKLRVRWRLDYQDAYTAPIDISVDATYAPELFGVGTYGVGAYGGTGGANTVYQEKVHVNRRCQAISFRVEDTQSLGNYGASFELSELQLYGGRLGRPFVPGAAKQA